jgi:hypothetical protein
MGKLINDEKFLEFKGETYTYGELHNLHYKKYKHYSEGEVINIYNGEILSIKDIKRFFQYSILELKENIKESHPEISKEKINYVANHIYDKQFKEQIKELSEKMESGDITEEEVILYWEIKTKGDKIEDIPTIWHPKNYIKINQDFLPNINTFSSEKYNLTESDKGKLFNLLYHITYNNQEKKESIKLNRELLSEILNTKSLSNIRTFMNKLEKNEILTREDKYTKSELNLIFNPLFVLKGREKELTYNLLKKFDKSFNRLLDNDLLKLIEVKENLNIVKVGIDIECIEEIEITEAEFKEN